MKLRRIMEHKINLLVIFALILANVSPACAFISGQHSSVIEICTADGVRTISVDVPNSGNETEQEHASSSDCNFCFNQSLGKTFSNDGSLVSTTIAFGDSASSYEAEAPQDFKKHVYIARAPPTFL